MKPSILKPALTATISSGLSSFIWGAPGIGKSDIVHEVSKDLNRDIIDLRAILLDPIDLRGLPNIDDNKTTWTVPSFLPQKGSGILFLDELNQAPQAVQAACFQLVLDRKLGDYTLPDGWDIIAAGNRLSDRAAAQRMPSALANRFVHLDLDPDLNDWCQWALQNDIAHEVIAFLRFRPELLHNFKPNDRSFPTPRSWAFISNLIQQDVDAEVEVELTLGTIGEAAGGEFRSFLRLYKDLPTIDSIFIDPQNAKVPTEPSARFAIASALSKRTTSDTLSNVGIYLDRLPDEFVAFTVKDLVKRTPDIQQTPAFTEWAVNHTNIFN